MKEFVIGLLFIVAGVVMMYYGPFLVRMFGRWKWAESYLGGTRQAYTLIGFAILMIGLLYMFGIIGTGDMTQINSGMGSRSSSESGEFDDSE